ncbi:TetR/AcrR family transcriptional regulator [Bradyrhizobium betae]|uniref:TetR/AcrR family transcriptional regulator n=1 Tax=Bradyrhizobium betae TaxID=244734 RepID=A0A5P6NZ06_9BRAD|nr:TetR/AcrR family transcriptional regulator [Bradyrhizobium betae]MCS3725324.1 AcrR family transcriptional regulator [Bradyrhizobium betae]QFI71357.1 TetR/AcrR family transcriptional regulator [Bradyrhizobium betae]
MDSRYLSAEERRQLTVETVVALAGVQNPSEITTAVIAKRMHVTQGALFRHFPSKDAIWQAVMDWVTVQLLGRIDQAADRAASPVEALRAMFMSHVDFVIAHPGVPRMLFGELQRAEATLAKKVVRSLLQGYAQRLTGQLERAKAAGEVESDTDTQAAAILFIGTIQGLVMQSLLSGDLQAARSNAPGVLGIYLRGLGAGRGDRIGGAIFPTQGA